MQNLVLFAFELRMLHQFENQMFFLSLAIFLRKFFLKKIFSEFKSKNAATPPKSSLLSNFCSATLAISGVLDEIWPIQMI